MNNQTRLAQVQSENDHLLTELINLNELLVEVGFEGGLETLKAAIEEVGTIGA